MAEGDARQLRDRAHELYEREQQFIAAAAARSQQLDTWQAQLSAARDRFRLDKAAQEQVIAARLAKLRRMRERIRPLYAAARRDRQRARTLLTRFLAHMKKRWAAERQAVAAQRAEVERCRTIVEVQSAAFLADQTRFSAEAAAYQQRLQQAWDLLTEGQRRLLADRQQAEQTLAERSALLDTRTRDVEAREQALAEGRARAEAQIREKLAEADRIEARIIRAREVLAELDARRAELLRSNPTAASFPDVVPLEAPSDPGHLQRLVADLAARDRELTREKYQIAQAKAEVERRAASLADDRAILGEQVAQLLVARERLQADQRQALIELEAAVRSVQAVELQAESRLKAAAEAERRNRTREADLVQFRLRLDAWQANLTAHEKAATAAREAATAELAARRAHLERWEAALTTLCHKWAALRKQEREQWIREFHQWKTARTNYADGVRALDRARADFLAQAAAAAQTQLAAEQVAADLAGGGRKAARRLAVLRRKWEGHFRRFQSELDERRRCLVQETVSANDRLEQFQQRLAEIMARTTELLAAQQQAELQHLTQQREEDERASMLPGVLARAERSEAALAEVRAEVERVAAAVMASGPEVPTQRSLPSGECVALARAA